MSAATLLMRQTDPIFRDAVDRLEQSLNDCFGTDFDLFIWQDKWQLFGNVEPQLASISDEVTAFAPNINRSLTTIHESQYAILPLNTLGEIPLLVVALADDMSERQLEVIGKLVQKNLSVHEQMECTAISLKESSRLRTFTTDLTSSLEAAKSSQSFIETASQVLSLLRSTINAESMALVPEGSSSPADFVTVGDQLGDRAEWERIVGARQKRDPGSPIFRGVCGVAYSAIRDFVIVPIRHSGRKLGWLVADVDDENSFGSSDEFLESVVTATASVLANQAVNEERLSQKELLLLDVVRSIVSAIDAKDAFTCGHSVRVATYASLVAKEMGLPQRECEEVYLSGLLHDVGKMGVPDKLFHKESELTEEEFQLVKQHPDHGWKILQRLEDLQHILPGVVHHHESFDGTGYPDQIAGEDIPLVARILATVDAYDALRSDRPYRKGMTHHDALATLLEGAETQWDPEVVDAVHCVSKKIERVSRKYRTESYLWRIPGTIEPQNKPEGEVTVV